MSFAYLPLYTGDYVRDTQHLSCTEHGIYIKLLIHCWDQKGPAPSDERRLMGIVNARSTDEIEAMRRVLNEYFVRMDDGWYNHRMQREIERCENISNSRSDGGKKGYQAKAKQMPSKCLTSVNHLPLSPSPSPSLSPEELTTLSGKPDRVNGLRPESKEVLAFLNEVTGRNYEPVDSNLELIAARLREGRTVDQLNAMVKEKARQWLNDKAWSKYLRPMTLFNASKCAQYMGEVGNHQENKVDWI